MDFNKCLQILAKLVSCHSASSDDEALDEGNAALISYVKDLLSTQGFNFKEIHYSDKWSNLLCTRGEPKVVFSAHSDTVPCAAGSWHSDPYTLTVKKDEDKAYGLGACDMKGFLAAVLTTACSSKFDMAILITAEEETSMNGAYAAASALKNEGVAYPLIVIGEPTLNTPVTAHKGWMYLELKITGKAAHSSAPHEGVNAIVKSSQLIKMLDDLKELWKSRVVKTGHSDYESIPTLNFGKVTGGDCANRVCDEVTLIMDVRPTQYYGIEKIKADILDLTTDFQKQEGSDTKVTISYPYPLIEPLKRSIQPDTVSLFENITSKKTVSVSYCTEASVLQELGPCVIMGPGSIAQAHTVDEYIALSSLKDAIGQISRLLHSLQ